GNKRKIGIGNTIHKICWIDHRIVAGATELTAGSLSRGLLVFAGVDRVFEIACRLISTSLPSPGISNVITCCVCVCCVALCPCLTLSRNLVSRNLTEVERNRGGRLATEHDADQNGEPAERRLILTGFLRTGIVTAHLHTAFLSWWALFV